jgi:hypothetical protein
MQRRIPNDAELRRVVAALGCDALTAAAHAATAQCTFCLDLPVGNAATWTNPEAEPTAACPRCGVERTIQDTSGHRRAIPVTREV